MRYLVNLKKTFTFASLYKARALSSAGSEHLPYKQGVNGSNPLAPTRKEKVSTLKLKPFLLEYEKLSCVCTIF